MINYHAIDLPGQMYAIFDLINQRKKFSFNADEQCTISMNLQASLNFLEAQKRATPYSLKLPDKTQLEVKILIIIRKFIF
jgi:hypothetical protein